MEWSLIGVGEMVVGYYDFVEVGCEVVFCRWWKVMEGRKGMWVVWFWVVLFENVVVYVMMSVFGVVLKGSDLS